MNKKPHHRNYKNLKSCKGYLFLSIGDIIRGDDEYLPDEHYGLPGHTWFKASDESPTDVGQPLRNDHVPFRRKIPKIMKISSNGEYELINLPE